MNAVFIVGIILATGFTFGEFARLARLPKVTGYIIAGIILNPTLTGVIPGDFVRHTSLATTIALSFITFSVGSALSVQRLRELGTSILFITVLEAEGAFFAVTAGFCGILYFFPLAGSGHWLFTAVPIALLLGSLACPTDPSATLAVTHEFHARGRISSTILSVAGLDDIMGLLNFTAASTIAGVLIGASKVSVTAVVMKTAWAVGGAVLVGVLCAAIFMAAMRAVRRETEGALIVLLLACICLCYGIASCIGADELLGTMSMGAVIVNFSRRQRQIFQLLERYTDELVFVLFFTISAMHLDFGVVAVVAILFVTFTFLRFTGKVGGTMLGGRMSGFTSGNFFRISLGLIPQGGIVIGLALSLVAKPEFTRYAPKIVAVIIGATIIHELVGPVLAVATLKSAGEIFGSDPAQTQESRPESGT